MSDTLMTIIGIVVATILMFVFPLMEISGKNDEMSQTIAEVVVSDFVNSVATKGKITQDDYNKLQTKLYATGNSYSIELEVQILDDNSRRASTVNNIKESGEYRYYSIYTDTIIDKINGDGEYPLKKDDYIIVNVKNTNLTIGTQLKNVFYKLVGKETYSIGASATALVVNAGRTQ